jgi:hypothetical protein
MHNDWNGLDDVKAFITEGTNRQTLKENSEE